MPSRGWPGRIWRGSCRFRSCSGRRWSAATTSGGTHCGWGSGRQAQYFQHRTNRCRSGHITDHHRVAPKQIAARARESSIKTRFVQEIACRLGTDGRPELLLRPSPKTTPTTKRTGKSEPAKTSVSTPGRPVLRHGERACETRSSFAVSPPKDRIWRVGRRPRHGVKAIFWRLMTARCFEVRRGGSGDRPRRRDHRGRAPGVRRAKDQLLHVHHRRHPDRRSDAGRRDGKSADSALSRHVGGDAGRRDLRVPRPDVDRL